ncbi:MAG TPA: DUF1634 domain-containing protein [Chitinophagaceae bacterium]|nr:DUF1634 domain-containing protein [Chitinophagaceae bacterium]
MGSNKKKWADKDIEASLGSLLRGGVLLSSAIVLLGGVLYLLRRGGMEPEYHTFRGLYQPFHTLPEVWTGIWQGKGQAIIQAGVILLIATPIARIVFSIIGFARERDRLYILIALIVLGIIMTSLLLGIKG